MPRIIGVDIPDNKKVLYSLQSLYGVGLHTAELVCQRAQVDPDKRARDLTTDEINRIQRALEQYLIEGDLRRDVSDNIDRKIRIGSYVGLRHRMKLPVRGQNTRRNARTARGSSGVRRTVGSMTKETAAKLETAKK